MPFGRPAVIAFAALILGACGASRGSTSHLDEASFRIAVRPALQRAGCAAATCHASGLIGLRLSAANGDATSDFGETSRLVRARDPAASPLYTKALGTSHL